MHVHRATRALRGNPVVVERIGRQLVERFKGGAVSGMRRILAEMGVTDGRVTLTELRNLLVDVGLDTTNSQVDALFDEFADEEGEKMDLGAFLSRIE